MREPCADLVAALYGCGVTAVLTADRKCALKRERIFYFTKSKITS